MKGEGVTCGRSHNPVSQLQILSTCSAPWATWRGSLGKGTLKMEAHPAMCFEAPPLYHSQTVWLRRKAGRRIQECGASKAGPQVGGLQERKGSCWGKAERGGLEGVAGTGIVACAQRELGSCGGVLRRGVRASCVCACACVLWC